jgi:HAD superfamily hydrolase (TIGR01549 family)
MPVAAIFDVDGTLVTFHFDTRGARKALIDELSASGFDAAGLDLNTPIQKILDAAHAQTPAKGESAYEAFRRQAYAIIDRFEEANTASATPFPGTREALERLKSKGVRLAVLTNSGRRAASEVLQRAGLQGLFEFVLTRDDTASMKPRPEGLTMALAMLGLPGAQVFYVGDSPYDIVAAKLAGMKIISVATGNYSEASLREEGADFVISSIARLPEVFNA